MNFCPDCGQRLVPGTRFCPGCGRALIDLESAASGSASSHASPEAAADTPFPVSPSPEAGKGEVLATLPKLQGPSNVRPIYYPPKAPAKPVDPMARAYRLTTLSTMINYAMVSQVASAVLGVAAVLYVLLGIQRSSFSADIVDNVLGDSSTLSVFLAVYVLGYLGGLLLGLLVTKTIRRRLPAQPPEQHPLSFGGFLCCALAAFGLWGVGVLIGNFPAYVVPVETMSFGWSSFPTWLLAIIVAPIFEELIFRKLVLDRVGSFGEAPAVLCSALLFGLAHQNAGQFFLAFLLGLLFARIYLHTGKIVYTMLLHFLINLTATFDEIGNLLWGDGFEIWFLIGIGALTLAGIVLLILRRKDPILRWPARLSWEERKNAFRVWSVTLVKWICVVTILLYGLLYALLGLVGGSFTLDDRVEPEPLGLLYLIPAALAVVFILILARRPKRQNAAAPVYAPVYAPVSEPAPVYAPAPAPVSEPVPESAPVSEPEHPAE